MKQPKYGFLLYLIPNIYFLILAARDISRLGFGLLLAIDLSNIGGELIEISEISNYSLLLKIGERSISLESHIIRILIYCIVWNCVLVPLIVFIRNRLAKRREAQCESADNEKLNPEESADDYIGE